MSRFQQDSRILREVYTRAHKKKKFVKKSAEKKLKIKAGLTGLKAKSGVIALGEYFTYLINTLRDEVEIVYAVRELVCVRNTFKCLSLICQSDYSLDTSTMNCVQCVEAVALAENSMIAYKHLKGASLIPSNIVLVRLAYSLRTKLIQESALHNRYVRLPGMKDCILQYQESLNRILKKSTILSFSSGENDGGLQALRHLDLILEGGLLVGISDFEAASSRHGTAYWSEEAEAVYSAASVPPKYRWIYTDISELQATHSLSPALQGM